MRLASALLFACLLQSSPADASALALGRIPFESGPRAGQPSVAVDPREGFVVTWQEREANGAVLRFAVIDEDGREVRRGEIARGDDWFVNGADFPSLAVLDNGDWVTFVLPKTSPGVYSYAIHTLRSRDAGVTWDAPVVIHRDGTDTEHGFVSMVPAGRDVVRAVWLDGRHMSGAEEGHHGAEHMTLRSAALARSGAPFDEVELDALTCACCQTSAARIDGRMRVVYRDRTAEETRDVFWVEHDGTRWGTPQQVHADGWTIAACPVNGPAIASNGHRFATVWPTMATGEMQVRFAIAAGAFQAPITLAGGADELGRVALVAVPTGWVASRVSVRQRVPTVVLSQLDAGGRAVTEAEVGERVGGYPRLAARGATVLVAWAEAGDSTGQSRIGLARVSLPAQPVVRGPTPNR